MTAVTQRHQHTTASPLDPNAAIALLSKVLAGSPHLPGALCRSAPALFDSEEPEDQADAIELCRRCPALTHCRTWIESLPTQRRPFGVVAGRTTAHIRTRTA